MAAYLKKPFSHNLLIARKPLIRVKYSHEIGEPLMKEMLAEIEKVRAHQ